MPGNIDKIQKSCFSVLAAEDLELARLRNHNILLTLLPVHQNIPVPEC